MTNFEKAKQWRAEHGYTGRGGVIVFWGDILQSWCRELPTAKDWCPGCVAVLEDGTCFTAIGGNDSDGAQGWCLMEEKAA